MSVDRLFSYTPPERERYGGMPVVDERMEQQLYELIGERVRARRGDMTQAELADRVGVGRTSITNLELGQQRMPLHYLLRIAEVLDCDLRELIPSRDEFMDGGKNPVVLGVQGILPPKTDRIIREHLNSEVAG